VKNGHGDANRIKSKSKLALDGESLNARAPDLLGGERVADSSGGLLQKK
jgi:hypothetical protein